MLKKGQISIFVIISAVIVIVSAFLFFNNDFSLFYSPEAELSDELQGHVYSCVQSNAELGIFLLGFQGGYVDVPQEIVADPTRRIVFNSNGTFDNSSLSIPNWDSELGEIPTLETMEVQLEQFIIENSQNCIESNFDAYQDYLNMEYSFDDFEIETSINDNNVEVDIDFPVSFNEIAGELESDFSSISLRIDTPLGDMFTLAKEIYLLEEQTLLFEQLVIDQIYSSGEDSSFETSMPTEGITFSCRPYIWQKSQLKETLANIQNQNFKYLYFEGTRPIDDKISANLGSSYEDYLPYYEANYNHELGSTKSSYQNYGVDIVMPTSTYTGSTGYFNSFTYREFEISPSNGELVKAMDFRIDIAGVDMPIPCMQIFHHLYTLDYDLLIQLRDYSQDEGDRYLFQFPLRIEIEDNTPKSSPQTSIEVEEPSTANNEVFCSQDNRNTQVEVYVQDDVSKDYLSNANVTYSCISLSCDLGTTQKQTYGFEEILRPNSIPVLNTSIGYCSGGELKVEKEGYFQIGQDRRIESGLNQEIQPVTALMVPTKEFSVSATTLSAIDYQTCNSFPRNEGQFLISVENNKYDFSSQAFYPRVTSGYMDTITLLEKPGVQYNVSVIYMRSDQPYGIMELENVELNYDAGNRLDIALPVFSTPITQDNALRYFEEVESVLSNDFTCPGVSFGIDIE